MCFGRVLWVLGAFEVFAGFLGGFGEVLRGSGEGFGFLRIVGVWGVWGGGFGRV